MRNKDDLIDSPIYTFKQREHRRLVALLLRSAGEVEKIALLLNAEQMYLAKYSIWTLRKQAEELDIPDELAESLNLLPWGYRKSESEFIGLDTDRVRSVYDFEDTPLLQCRTGRRARLANKIACLDPKNLRFCVLTSPALVPLLGDLEAAIDAHMRSVSDFVKAARQRGFEFIVRSTEFAVSHKGVNIHTNFIFRGIGNVPTVIDCRISDDKVYNIAKLADYILKSPVKFDEKFISEMRESLNIFCNRQKVRETIEASEYREAAVYDTEGLARVFCSSAVEEEQTYSGKVLLWLYNGLRGRRLLSSGHGVSWDVKQQDDGERVKIEHVCTPLDALTRQALGCDSDDNKNSPCLTRQRPAFKRPTWRGENVIVKISKAKLHVSGVIEPCILVKNFTRCPITKLGKQNLAQIRRLQAEYHANQTKNSYDANRRYEKIAAKIAIDANIELAFAEAFD